MLAYREERIESTEGNLKQINMWLEGLEKKEPRYTQSERETEAMDWIGEGQLGPAI